jgi:(p)ppGpp synthase/HD superfamily hydrolase
MTTHYYEAVVFAKEAHAGQVDKAGKDYFIYHLEAVVKIIREELGGTIHDAVVGYLHDVIEDTDTTVKDLMEKFGGAITRDVLMLSKSEGTPYWKYIEDIAEHGSKSARLVKRADLLDHVRKSAAIPASLLKRYTKSMAVLDEAEKRYSAATV